MATYPALVSLSSPTVAPGLLGAASRELERQMTELIPAGKTGGLIGIVDKHGVSIGVAAVIDGAIFDVKVAAEVKQRWATVAPEAKLTLQVTWP